MRKLNILVLLLMLFICGLTYAKGENSGIPTEEQVQKLVTAAWKEPIESIDIEFYKEYTGIPVSTEQLQKEVEDYVDEEYKQRGLNKEHLPPYEVERRKKRIEINLETRVEHQEFPRKLRERVQISGDKQRTDFVKVGPNEPLGLDTPFIHTFINTKDANTGDFVSYHYAGDMNTAFINKTKWTKKTIAQFAGIPSATASALQLFLGGNQDTLTSPVFVPDPNKMKKLAEIGIVTIEEGASIGAGVKAKKQGVNRISIYPDPNAPSNRDRIEISIPDYFPMIVLICDRNDYSRVYRFEGHNLMTNQITSIRECDDFDTQGFPHNVTEIKYDEDGNFVEKSVYRIIKVELNPSIPAEVFEFHPPEGYKVMDHRPKKP